MHSILHTARAAAAGILLTALLLYPGTKPVGKVLPCALYYHGAGDSPRIALTFDDGPHPRYTPQILEILSEYRAPATFFVIGKNAQDYPDLVRRISAEGHEIANHTYSHRRIKDLSDQEIREEMDHCEQILLEIVNLRPALFRPPEGSINDSARLSAKDHGYDIVLWSVDTRD
jgi:peptidoglycan/xylan/chitin deacetylase (PgdA/CDA1 family)